MKRAGTIATLAVLLLMTAAAAHAADVTGRGMIGGSAGPMVFLSGESLSDGEARLMGQFSIKYPFSPTLAAIADVGWGWNTLSSGDQDTMMIVVPLTAGLEYRMRYGESKLWPHLGAGLGLYSYRVAHTYRSTSQDEVSGEEITWSSLGLFLKAGGDIVFENFAAVNLDLVFHQVFSGEGDRFVRGWGDGANSFVQFRIGGSYYFSLGGEAEAAPAKEGE